jgi:dUTP pyrophosphatase
MEVKVKVLNSNAIVPEYKTPGAAGMDLHAAESTYLYTGDSVVIGTGLAFEIPEGYEMQIRPRSGLAAKNCITVLNSPGTVDCDYRGEVKVILINHGDSGFRVSVGERIAQAIFAPVTRAKLNIVDTLDDTERGEGGFGSTGK